MKTRKPAGDALTDFPQRKLIIAVMGAGLSLIFLTSFMAGGRVPVATLTQARTAAQSDVTTTVSALMTKLKANPDDEATILELAEMFSRLRDWQKAEHFWSRAVAVDPKNLGARYHRGTALVQLGRYDEAVKDYEFILQIEPQAYQALYYLGVINKYGLKNAATAKTYFQQALDLKPVHPEIAEEIEKELADLK